VRLTVVGCAGSFPGPDSPASCYLVQADHDGRTYSLVLDLGNGALGALQRHVALEDVDVVALSHLHVDHWIDLTSFYVVRTYHPGGPLPRLPVVGPVDTAQRLARAYGGADDTGRADEVFEFVDWKQGRSLTYGPFTLRVARMAHPIEAYAVRVEQGGRALVYSGDTGPCDALVELATGAELLLCEASFLERHHRPPDLHMTGLEAAEHATRAGVGKLMLTHVPPWMDRADVLAEAMPAFSGPIDLAEPGATHDIGSPT